MNESLTLYDQKLTKKGFVAIKDPANSLARTYEHTKGKRIRVKIECNSGEDPSAATVKSIYSIPMSKDWKHDTYSGNIDEVMYEIDEVIIENS